jgi:hypothetical protein
MYVCPEAISVHCMLAWLVLEFWLSQPWRRTIMRRQSCGARVEPLSEEMAHLCLSPPPARWLASAQDGAAVLSRADKHRSPFWAACHGDVRHRDASCCPRLLQSQQHFSLSLRPCRLPFL